MPEVSDDHARSVTDEMISSDRPTVWSLIRNSAVSCVKICVILVVDLSLLVMKSKCIAYSPLETGSCFTQVLK
jgi:hypothetical protein